MVNQKTSFSRLLLSVCAKCNFHRAGVPKLLLPFGFGWNINCNCVRPEKYKIKASAKKRQFQLTGCVKPLAQSCIMQKSRSLLQMLLLPSSKVKTKHLLSQHILKHTFIPKLLSKERISISVDQCWCLLCTEAVYMHQRDKYRPQADRNGNLLEIFLVFI